MIKRRSHLEGIYFSSSTRKWESLVKRSTKYNWYRENQVLLWWHHEIEIFSVLLALCEGNPPVTGGFPLQRPVTQSFDVFFDLRMNKRLSKQSRHRWFKDLRRHGACATLLTVSKMILNQILWRISNHSISRDDTPRNVYKLLIPTISIDVDHKKGGLSANETWPPNVAD